MSDLTPRVARILALASIGAKYPGPSPEQIRAEMDRLGMSTAEFAHEMQVDPRAVQRWLDGSRTMSATAWRLARALPLDD